MKPKPSVSFNTNDYCGGGRNTPTVIVGSPIWRSTRYAHRQGVHWKEGYSEWMDVVVVVSQSGNRQPVAPKWDQCFSQEMRNRTKSPPVLVKCLWRLYVTDYKLIILTHRLFCKSAPLMTGLTRTISAPKKIGPTSNYRVAPWFISTSSVDQIMQFTYLPWVVEIPNLEDIVVNSQPSHVQKRSCCFQDPPSILRLRLNC